MFKDFELCDGSNKISILSPEKHSVRDLGRKHARRRNSFSLYLPQTPITSENVKSDTDSVEFDLGMKLRVNY